jgi:DNA-binding PadR family transcriptional regulator
MHGYELYRQIQAEGIDAWFSISAAGVYYSLRKLRDLALVAESRQRRGQSSRKSIYRLTDSGRMAFFPALEAELNREDQIFLGYDLGIYLLNRLPLDRAIPQLEQRQAYLSKQAQQIAAARDALRNNGWSPLQSAILDHKLRFLEMEQGWLADVIQSIQEEPVIGEASEKRGMMILRGDLRDYHLPDLLRLIVSGKHSGTLRATDGAEVRSLSFEAGRPVRASLLRQDQGTPPAESCDQVLDGLCELFRWREGQFTFDQRYAPDELGVAVNCTAEELILRGCRKVGTWTIIQRLVPSADTIFELGVPSEQVANLDLTRLEEQVRAVVDGVKDVAAIARELELTLFETSKAVYCLAAIGILRTVDADKIRLRRVFRELAELMCNSTLPWRASPDDRSCEEEVNSRCQHLPLRLERGRIEDRAEPQLAADQMVAMYQEFLREQFSVVSRRFGSSNANKAFEQTLEQLAPELQGVAKRYGFDRISRN